jgi:hypothetical protein
MGVKVTNNAFGTLLSGISSSATTITLDSGQGAKFPTLGGSDFFFATLIDTSNNLEIVKITARSTDSLTAVRAQDNTSARAFSAGDRIELRPTAAMFESLSTPDDATTSSKGIASFSSDNFAVGSGAVTIKDLGVATAEIQANAVTAAKFNADVISGQTELAAEPADTDEFLVSDAGVLKRMDYSHIKAGAVTVSQKATTSSSGTFTISSLTIAIPLFIVADGSSGNKPEIKFRVTAGATGGATENSSNFFFVGANDSNVTQNTVPGFVLIPTATTVTLDVNSAAGTLTAFQ